MLILTRGVRQSIRIGDGIRLTLLSKQHDLASVCLDTPSETWVIDDGNTVLKPTKQEHQRKRYYLYVLLGDSIQIGDDVVVVIGACPPWKLEDTTRRDQIRIGISAPRDIPVHREEVYRRIKRGDTWPRQESH
jgi:carbon storage regulator